MPTRSKSKRSTRKKSKPKKSRGAPTKYDPKFCELVVKEMGQGKTLNEFAHKIGVHKDTIFEWRKVHSVFSDSIKRGRMAGEAWWMRQARRNLVLSRSLQFNTAVWIFAMKNMFGWEETPGPPEDDAPDGVNFVQPV